MSRAIGLLQVSLLLVVAAACGKSGTPTSPTPNAAAPPAAMSGAARTHLTELLNTMQQNSIKRLTLDWASLRARVEEQAVSAQAIPDLYPAIRLALSLIGDGHSSYRSADGATNIFVGNRTCSPSGRATPAIPSTIGYVYVGAFSGTAAQATDFANGIQRTIAEADRDDLAGWIVDLRSNGGGNMWPMIAGLGPILGEDILGYFIDPVGAQFAWEYRNGSALSGGVAAAAVSAPYRLRRERPRVAVLSDNAIASSGEAALIAFRQRPNARSFGVATCGLSTANRGFPLTNGANLNLTVSTMADRTRQVYGDQVPPDEVIADTAQAVQRAIAWLQTGT